MRCQRCLKVGHNKRSCKNEAAPKPQKAKRGRPRIHAFPSGSENVPAVPPTQGSGHIASPPTQDNSHLTAPPTQETGRKRKNPTQENEIHIAQTMKDRALRQDRFT
ncbi:mutator-like transposase [Striga asiatica]|uniref:Mutator-like transposase n=1 Tax=Striga asiatica TaxID=4170 RepID=A0A5A7QU90_STRAF|nr:mutator-like transposase [Striga asiatica]